MIGGMKKGLFGKRQMMPGLVSGFGGGTFNMDGTQATPSMPQNETMTTAQRLVANAPMPQERQSFWQGGDKFTARDGIAGALAAIGDGLQSWAGGRGGAVANLAQSRALPGQMQAQAQLAEAQRLAGLQDYRAKKGIDQEFDSPKLGSFDWFQTATPEQRQQYSQYMDVTSPAMATTWQGPTILPRSQLMPSAPVGRLTPIGEGQAPTIMNTPAPQLGANGMPAAVNSAQYQAIVEAMGPEQAASWARRNNVRVGN